MSFFSELWLGFSEVKTVAASIVWRLE